MNIPHETIQYLLFLAPPFLKVNLRGLREPGSSSSEHENDLGMLSNDGDSPKLLSDEYIFLRLVVTCELPLRKAFGLVIICWGGGGGGGGGGGMDLDL